MCRNVFGLADELFISQLSRREGEGGGSVANDAQYDTYLPQRVRGCVTIMHINKSSVWGWLEQFSMFPIGRRPLLGNFLVT